MLHNMQEMGQQFMHDAAGDVADVCSCDKLRALQNVELIIQCMQNVEPIIQCMHAAPTHDGNAWPVSICNAMLPLPYKLWRHCLGMLGCFTLDAMALFCLCLQGSVEAVTVQLAAADLLAILCSQSSSMSQHIIESGGLAVLQALLPEPPPPPPTAEELAACAASSATAESASEEGAKSLHKPAASKV
jgi:hypothetical protein